MISLLVSLTLSPALAALLLKPHKPHDADARKRGPIGTGFHYLGMAGAKFNQGFDWLSDRYGRLTARLVRTVAIVLIIYVGLLALTGWRLMDTPTGFIPEQDQGFLIGVVQLPPGASLDRTEAAMTRAVEIVRSTEGVDRRGRLRRPGRHQLLGGLELRHHVHPPRRSRRAFVARTDRLGPGRAAQHGRRRYRGSADLHDRAPCGAGSGQRQRLRHDGPGPFRRRLSRRCRAPPTP